jgi:hypothetical protein
MAPSTDYARLSEPLSVICSGGITSTAANSSVITWTMNRPQRSALRDGLCYAALTILVWGPNALQRGLWQDDVQALGEAFRRSFRSDYFRALFPPDASPLRRMTLLPSVIANATPQPIWALQILCGAVWLAHGLLAGWIVGLLLPGRRWTVFVVVCLTLTATSDLTTGSMVTLANNVAALLVLAAVGCALTWLVHGGIVALVASLILLAGSLLTMDVALPAVPFLALLFVGFGGWHLIPRVSGLLAAWGIVLVPVAIVEFSFLYDPTSYAAMALVAPSKDVIVRTIVLWLDNFAPWRWPFARPEWYARPSAVIPTVWMAAGALLAASLFLIRARTKSDDAGSEDGPRSVQFAVLFATMALASNAVYALVWFSEFHYRTHILSRVWASMAIGILAGWAGMRRPGLRWAASAIVTAFVFFGTWGGIERQDFFLASWREHQRELASILNAAPSFRPGTAVILRSTATSGRYLATEADYLTKHWLRLLYNDPTLRAMRLNPERGSGCKPTAGGIDCWLEGEAWCFANKTCEPTRFPFEDLVVMDYDSSSGTWHLVPSLDDDPLGRSYDGEAERYRPENRIVPQPRTLRQRRLLLMEE